MAGLAGSNFDLGLGFGFGFGFALSGGYLNLNAAIRMAEKQRCRERRRQRFLIMRRRRTHSNNNGVLGQQVQPEVEEEVRDVGNMLEGRVNPVNDGMDGVRVGVPSAAVGGIPRVNPVNGGADGVRVDVSSAAVGGIPRLNPVNGGAGSVSVGVPSTAAGGIPRVNPMNGGTDGVRFGVPSAAAGGIPRVNPVDGGVDGLRVGVPSAAAGGIPSLNPVNSGVDGVRVGVRNAAAYNPETLVRGRLVPQVGAISVKGMMFRMEDAICIKTKLCSPAINGYFPVHFFGVFDGHGGAHFSNLCKKRMHQLLKEQLTGVAMQPYPMWPGFPTMSGETPPGLISDESVLQETWKKVMRHCFVRTETVVSQTCPCGKMLYRCQQHQQHQVNVTFSGTTALTVVLTENHIVTANCGDSRAVLCRGGIIVPLSFDHKADRSDERARIESIGGQIIYKDTHRVEGISSITRAIGDRFLKPLVISDPEVTFIRRNREDEFIILASDSFWEVMSIEMAVNVARNCLMVNDPNAAINPGDGCHIGPPPGFEPMVELQPNEASITSESAHVAALLCRLAVTLGSPDNISVIVIDLKRGS